MAVAQRRKWIGWAIDSHVARSAAQIGMMATAGLLRAMLKFDELAPWNGSQEAEARMPQIRHALGPKFSNHVPPTVWPPVSRPVGLISL